ncbi:MAG TPA: hypothetical protein DHW82_12765 [Spirochaetia bacterium]|nr:MAG: hypothetical protein A2Y41_03225 [Spirochaetes bacterium GWB1_36_13]HCL57861.1 hypothetical protein [Spirochaetia bacterium]
MKKLFLISFLLLLTSPLFAEKIEIYGKVVDKTTKTGIEGVTVIFFPTGEKTITIANGNFSLTAEKQDGMFLQIMKSGYNSIKIKSNLEEVYAELELATKVEGQKITVKGKRDEKKVIISRQQVDQKNIERSTANLFGDSVKVIQTLPGVVTMGEMSALMYVRGGDAYEIMNYYDRLLMVDAYVWGGMMSVFNPDLVKTIDFYSGAFPAQYGNAMSGILDAKMKDGTTEETKGFLDLSLTTLTGIIEGPIGEKGKTDDSYMIGVRRTHYDLAIKLMTETGVIKGNYEGVQFPFFYDAHLHFKFQLDPVNILRVYSLLVYEGMDFTFDADPDGETQEGWKSGNEFHYKDFKYMQGVSLTSAFSDKLIMENTLGFSLENGNFKYVDQYNPVHFKTSYNYSLYQNDLTWKPNDSHILKFGLGAYAYVLSMDMDIVINRIPAGFAPITTGEIPILATDIPYYEYSQDYTSKLFFIGNFYVQDDIELAKDFFFLNLGFRTEWFNINKKFTADPRIGIKLVFDDLLTAKVAGGIYSQQISDGRYYDKKYGNPNLDPQKAYHLVLSFEKDTPDYFFRLDFFGKQYKDLVTEDYRDNFKNGGIGYSYGAELFLQKKIIGNWDGWISYTFVVTRRKITDRISKDDYNTTVAPSQMKGDYELPFNQWYAPAYDRQHSLNIILNYNFDEKWQLSTTTKLFTGLPYTPLDGRNVYSARTNINDANTETRKLYSPIYGSYNSDRMPFYANMDVKLTMPFFWDNCSSFVQAMNVFYLFGAKKIMRYFYDETYTIRKEEQGLPFMIILGVKAKF